MKTLDAKVADMLLYSLLSIQLIAAIVLFFIYNNDEYDFLNSVLIVFLYFTGIPVIGTFLIVLSEKSQKKNK